MTSKKYKLSDLAKDLNVNQNEIIDILKTGDDEQLKKGASILNEDELTKVFETLTKNNEVKSFDEFFASRDKKKEEPKKEEKEIKETISKKETVAEKEADVKKEIKKEPEQKKTFEKKPEQQQTFEKKPEQQKTVQRDNNPKPQVFKNEGRKPEYKKENTQDRRPKQFNNNNNTNNTNRPNTNTNTNRPGVNNNSGLRPNTNGTVGNNNNPSSPTMNPFKKHEHQNQNQPQKERTVRTVDTKTVEVNLDKYNEKYEQIAPDQNNKRQDNFQRRQKLNQKSQQRQKQKYGNKKAFETEAQKLQRLELERARKQQLKVKIPDEITVSELASRLKVNAAEVIKRLMLLGVMAAQNDIIDFDTASLVADELGAKVEKEVIVTIEERLIDDSDDNDENLTRRSPVVVVMGHVDHGKTSLLDKIRNAHVTSGEAGGITQHIGAYTVNSNGNPITFLDTPGHEAFTAMRARGAAVTDIVILVVAADDGIMPQTIEAINHAKAANVQIIVAINKMDKPHANKDKVMQELTEYELIPEEWGGDTICCPVSALTGEGIDQLLDTVNLVAEVADLKANPDRLAKGTIVEARLDKGRGPVATLLVQNGTLHLGDVIIAGTSLGKVRVMLNDKGEEVTEAGPSIPVEITGLDQVPDAGDIFNAVEDEKLARNLADKRKFEQKEEEFKRYQKVTLDNLFSQIEEGEIKELPIIVKADVQGSAEAVKQSLEKLSNNEVHVRVIHQGVGAVNKSDVMLAEASNAIIIGFNVRPDQTVRDDMDKNEVEIRLYRIIYDAIDDVQQAMKGMLAPKTREVELGRAEVRQVYKISNVGAIAGCYVIDGKVARNALIRVVRDGIVIIEDKIDSLKRFKDDAKEVAQGYECGIGLDKFNDIKEGDIFESFIVEEYRED